MYAPQKKGKGKMAKLQPAHQEKIKQLLAGESPEDYGCKTATWTRSLLMEWLKSQYGIEYKKAQSYNIIKSLCFTYHKCKGIFPEVDAEKQEVFNECLKKTAPRNA